MNKVHPLFADILKPYTPLPVPDTGSVTVNKALTGLGLAVVAKEIATHDREIRREMDCSDRLVDDIRDLMAEERDALTDFARDEAVRKITTARAEREQCAKRIVLRLERIKHAYPLNAHRS